MSKFRKKGKKGNAPVSTASLPDIVFMLLFFFMVVTTMREEELLVKADNPESVEFTRIENAALTDHIYVGPPVENLNDLPVIQLDDWPLPTINVDDALQIVTWIHQKREALAPVEKREAVVSLQVDGAVNMGIVGTIKEQLREANALKIIYKTRRAR